MPPTAKRKRAITTATTTTSPPAPKQTKKTPRRAPEKLHFTSSETTPHSQRQSPLFHLPPELRNIIYSYIFTFPTAVHIAYVGGRMNRFRSFLCTVPKKDRLELEENRERLCCRCEINHRLCSPRDGKGSWDVQRRPTAVQMRERRVAGLLRSCKMVYTETIEMLYTTNTFYFENPRTVLEMPTHMSQSTLSFFLDVTVESPRCGEGTPPSAMKRWGEVLDALGKFDRLESLCIILRPMWGLTGEIDDLLNPIKKRKGMFPVPPRVISDRVGRMTPTMAGQGWCVRHGGDKRKEGSKGMNWAVTYAI
ncbi:hypothetical protein BJY04DRAFT_114445 [Aspergillus karnatakaensis]|uniref:uncharacterized protein n=1 Tax=Aspergillus karnatakaensis TaxID=1810916 RepID=UPI003CCE1609